MLSERQVRNVGFVSVDYDNLPKRLVATRYWSRGMGDMFGDVAAVS